MPCGSLRSVSDFWSCGPSVLWWIFAGYWCHLPGIDKKKIIITDLQVLPCVESGILQMTLTRLNSVTVYSPWILHYSKFMLLYFLLDLKCCFSCKIGVWNFCTTFLLAFWKETEQKKIQPRALVNVFFSVNRNLYGIGGFNLCFPLYYCLFLMSHD